MSLSIQDTAFARLEREGRLLNSVLKAPTKKAGRFGFRGDLALKFPAKLADEARPPEISSDQVIAAATAGKPTLDFVCGFLLSFEYLQLVAEVLGDLLSPEGTYVFFCDNIDLSQKYLCDHGGATFVILPIDEATVYNEMLELLYLAEWLGGPKRYSTERGQPRLRRVHMPFAIDTDARDAWLACMHQALDEIGADAALRDELLAAFAKVADHLKNTDTDSTHRSP